MPMKNPAHPGRIVRHACLEPLGLSVTEGAKILGVTRQALNNIVNWQVRHQRRNGYPAHEGVRQHRGNVVADAACLRSCTGPQERKQNQGSPSARPARVACQLTAHVAQTDPATPMAVMLSKAFRR